MSGAIAGLLALDHELRIVCARSEMLTGELEVLRLVGDHSTPGAPLGGVPADAVADIEGSSHTGSVPISGCSRTSKALLRARGFDPRPISAATRQRPRASTERCLHFAAMKKLLILVVFVALAAVAAKKVRSA
jgi:hypothetical protein